MPITSKDAPGNAKKVATQEPQEVMVQEVKAEPAKKVKVTYVATQSGVSNIDGAMFQFSRGVTHVTDDHPAYKKHPELFTKAEDRARPVIEQATAAPGEERGS
jgi:hypothetical protein